MPDPILQNCAWAHGGPFGWSTCTSTCQHTYTSKPSLQIPDYTSWNLTAPELVLCADNTWMESTPWRYMCEWNGGHFQIQEQDSVTTVPPIGMILPRRCADYSTRIRTLASVQIPDDLHSKLVAVVGMCTLRHCRTSYISTVYLPVYIVACLT